MVYDLAPATKSALGQRKRENGMARALRFLDTVGATFAFPNSGPPALLDDDLFAYNDIDDSSDNPFPDQTVFLEYLAAHGHDNGRLLIPGSTADLQPATDGVRASCTVVHPVPDADVASIFTGKAAYLEAYAARERTRIAAERPPGPPSKETSPRRWRNGGTRCWSWPDRIGPVSACPVLLEIGDEKVVIDFACPPGSALGRRGMPLPLRHAHQLVEALVADTRDRLGEQPVPVIRFRAARQGAYNEYIYTFFKCLAPERLSYAEGWYAEQEERTTSCGSATTWCSAAART